ncbi:hypothetical protein KF707_12610 [Candidatus Obscuribacterales bacterium]|jgi:hypothetical protein|nr:hypothetical protein [Candidatus Obscuribacterales bacterium]
MFLTPEQLQLIQDALEYSCTALSDEFEQNKHSREADEIQRSVLVYGKLRKYNKLLNDIRKSLPAPPTIRENNVLVLAASRGR